MRNEKLKIRLPKFSVVLKLQQKTKRWFIQID